MCLELREWMKTLTRKYIMGKGKKDDQHAVNLTSKIC